MSFEHHLKISADRLGVLVGKKGKTKVEIEKKCGVELNIDSKTGDVKIININDISKSIPFKAVEIITAISKGFSPERALKLLAEEEELKQVDLRDYSGKSEASMSRIKGRIIGLKGKTRKIIEDLGQAGTFDPREHKEKY